MDCDLFHTTALINGYTQLCALIDPGSSAFISTGYTWSIRWYVRCHQSGDTHDLRYWRFTDRKDLGLCRPQPKRGYDFGDAMVEAL